MADALGLPFTGVCSAAITLSMVENTLLFCDVVAGVTENVSVDAGVPEIVTFMPLPRSIGEPAV